MNAYELADELLRDNTQLTVTSAYILRQQADRIAELEKRVVALTMNLNTKAIKVSELERKLNNV